MSYEIHLSTNAKEGLIKLKRSEPRAFEKARGMLHELEDHPRTGTGKPHELTGNRAGQWSRRITRKHRLIYEVVDRVQTVLVLSSYGHYDDK